MGCCLAIKQIENEKREQNHKNHIDMGGMPPKSPHMHAPVATTTFSDRKDNDNTGSNSSDDSIYEEHKSINRQTTATPIPYFNNNSSHNSGNSHSSQQLQRIKTDTPMQPNVMLDNQNEKLTLPALPQEPDRSPTDESSAAGDSMYDNNINNTPNPLIPPSVAVSISNISNLNNSKFNTYVQKLSKPKLHDISSMGSIGDVDVVVLQKFARHTLGLGIDIGELKHNQKPVPQPVPPVAAVMDNGNNSMKQKEIAEVKTWISSTCGCPQYFELFISNGFDSLNIIRLIESKIELREIGIILRGHQTKIWSEIKKLAKAMGTPSSDQYDNDINKNDIDIDNNNVECVHNLSKCLIVNRLFKIMISYETWNEIKDGSVKWQSISNIFGKYKLNQLIDDYNHYLSNHDNKKNLKIIHNNLLKHIHSPCYKDHSIDAIGNGRRQLSILTNDKVHKLKLMNDKTIKQEDIFRLEIADKIHIYWMHKRKDHKSIDNSYYIVVVPSVFIFCVVFC